MESRGDGVRRGRRRRDGSEERASWWSHVDSRFRRPPRASPSSFLALLFFPSFFLPPFLFPCSSSLTFSFYPPFLSISFSSLSLPFSFPPFSFSPFSCLLSIFPVTLYVFLVRFFLFPFRPLPFLCIFILLLVPCLQLSQRHFCLQIYQTWHM